MKNKLIFALLLCFLLTSMLLVSCSSGGENDGETCAHEVTEWKVDKNATCTESGSKHKECTECKKSIEVAVIDKVQHTEEIVKGSAATCTEAGLTDGKICSVCKTVIVEQQTISLKAHTEEIVKGTLPTCTETGLTDGKKCSVCNTVLVAQEEISAKSHSESDWIIDKNAEIGVEGRKHTECLDCKVPMKSDVIPALPETHVHAGVEWVTVVPATCKIEGSKAFICSCGITMDTASIGVIAHKEEVIPAVPSTCKSTGLTEGKKCSACGDILVGQSTTAKSGHTEETILGIKATCTTSGLTDGKKCSVCTTVTVSQQVIPPTGHSFKDGTCQGCGTVEPYGVWIVDGLGNPMSDIIVKVMKDGELVKMYPYKGEFLSMPLDNGSYQLELDLSQLGASYTFDEAACVLTPQARTTVIRLFQGIVAETEFFVGYPIEADYKAYYISAGSTMVTLTPNDYTFFIFAPETAAIYTITYECSSNLQISYHGGSFFAQGRDLTPDSSDANFYENGISLNVYASNIGSEYVIGVTSASADSCILNIKNVGDPGTRIEDAPWTSYLEDEDKVEADLSVSKDGVYTTIDISDLTVKAVYNETDGYYHLGTADGPIIFIDLTSDSSYVSSIQTICGNQRMGAYIYDPYGNVVEKRSYNELFIQYGMPETADSVVQDPVRVPLTEKLAEAIKSFGDKNGWWDPDAESNIFKTALLGAPYNQEYAWLLFCGYYAN